MSKKKNSTINKELLDQLRGVKTQGGISNPEDPKSPPSPQQPITPQSPTQPEESPSPESVVSPVMGNNETIDIQSTTLPKEGESVGTEKPEPKPLAFEVDSIYPPQGTLGGMPKEVEVEGMRKVMEAIKLETPQCLIARDVREYCTEHGVAMVMKALCDNVREALPNYRAWDTEVDPVVATYKLIRKEGYVERLVPVLEMMLGDSIKNVMWSAKVVIAIAVYDMAKALAAQRHAQLAREGK